MLPARAGFFPDSCNRQHPMLMPMAIATPIAGKIHGIASMRLLLVLACVGRQISARYPTMAACPLLSPAFISILSYCSLGTAKV